MGGLGFSSIGDILPFRHHTPSLRHLPHFPHVPPGRRPWEPRRILDPGGRVIVRWNGVFLVSCLAALFLDPMYFYVLYIAGDACMSMDISIATIITVLRTITDIFYFAHCVLKFRIAFVSPSSRVFGRGELVRDPQQIAARYIRKDFIFDAIASLPIPQVTDA